MGAAAGGQNACIFCRIIDRSAASTIVYEDAENLAFLDLFPVTRGHLLIVPKLHVDRLVDLPESAYEGLFKAIATVCRRVEGLSTHYNVSMNQGELAGQIVFHLHVHVIPRYGEGTPQWSRPRERLREEDAAQLSALLRAS